MELAYLLLYAMHLLDAGNEAAYFLKKNIPSVIPQVRSGEARMYTNLTPTFCGIERLFPLDPWLKKFSRSRKENLIAMHAKNWVLR